MSISKDVFKASGIVRGWRKKPRRGVFLAGSATVVTVRSKRSFRQRDIYRVDAMIAAPADQGRMAWVEMSQSQTH